MAKKKYSRLSYPYLASRYAGVTFLLAALGLLAGMIYLTLFQPTRYAATATADVALVPREAGTNFDWPEELRQWRGYLQNRGDWGMLAVNLRHAVKLAVTRDMHIDADSLNAQLAQFAPAASFSAALLRGPWARWLGPTLEVARGDLAGNLDFQSLAVIAGDTTPPHNVSGWDFSFFHAQAPHKNGIIARPSPDDRYFRVFYQIHRALTGREPASPLAAWRTTVEEIKARLERESTFAGGGGFGHQARRELVREMTAIPILAANSLYHANRGLLGESEPHIADVWRRNWGGLEMDLRRVSPAAGVASVRMEISLNPLSFPRDTNVTRLPPLVVATVLSFLASREVIDDVAAEPPLLESESVVYSDPVGETLAAAAETKTPKPESVVTYREVIDDVADKQRLAHIGMSEEAVKIAGRERDASVRRLETARANENRLSHETIAARNRADRLRERYDETSRLVEADSAPKVPADTAKLFTRRDELLRRLAGLLEYCTDEHPFVKEVRREIASLDVLLAAHKPDAAQNAAAEARATRLANLYLEWESAVDQAESLEERARRQSEAVACLLEEVTSLERCLTQREFELIQARAVPVPITRIAVAVETSPPPTPAPAPVSVAVAAPVFEPSPRVAPAQPRLAFSAMPTAIPLVRMASSWRPLLWGLLAGLALALLWLLLREIFGQLFHNVGEAHRLVGLPVLAALPAYDAVSYRLAADTVPGELVHTRGGRMQFIPAPVEVEEPPAEGRRGKILPARRPRHWLRWLLGFIFLLLSLFLYYRHATTGFAQPYTLPGDTLPLPEAAYSAWTQEGEAQDWGDLP